MPQQTEILSANLCSVAMQFHRSVELPSPSNIFLAFDHETSSGFYRTSAFEASKGITKASFDADFRVTSVEYQTQGEDPRLFAFKGLTWVVDNTYNNVSLFTSTNPTVRVKLPFKGKNFTFIPDTNKLYVITWFDPLTVYTTTDIHENNWTQLVISQSNLHPCQSLAASSQEFRGGTPGYALPSAPTLFYGFGHRTWTHKNITHSTLYGNVEDNGVVKHVPFLWVFDTMHVCLEVHNLPDIFQNNITDPVCVSKNKENQQTMLICAGSNDIWCKQQAYTNMMYTFSIVELLNNKRLPNSNPPLNSTPLSQKPLPPPLSRNEIREDFYGIHIIKGVAQACGTPPDNDCSHFVATLVECLNVYVLPTLEREVPEGFFPIGHQQSKHYPFSWDVSVEQTGNQTILVPDLRWHAETSENMYIDKCKEGQALAYAPPPSEISSYIERYPQLSCVNMIPEPKRQKILEMIFAFENKWLPLKDRPPAPPYFVVDVENQARLVTKSAEQQLELEMYVTNYIKHMLMPEWNIDWTGYYPLYGCFYPLPLDTTHNVVIKSNNYRKWVESLQDGALIISRDTYKYWFSDMLKDNVTHIMHSGGELHLTIDTAQQIRWNAVLVSRFITKQKALEYLKRLVLSHCAI